MRLTLIFTKNDTLKRGRGRNGGTTYAKPNAALHFDGFQRAWMDALRAKAKEMSLPPCRVILGQSGDKTSEVHIDTTYAINLSHEELVAAFSQLSYSSPTPINSRSQKLKGPALEDLKMV